MKLSKVEPEIGEVWKWKDHDDPYYAVVLVMWIGQEYTVSGTNYCHFTGLILDAGPKNNLFGLASPLSSQHWNKVL